MLTSISASGIADKVLGKKNSLTIKWDDSAANETAPTCKKLQVPCIEQMPEQSFSFQEDERSNIEGLVASGSFKIVSGGAFAFTILLDSTMEHSDCILSISSFLEEFVDITIFADQNNGTKPRQCLLLRGKDTEIPVRLKSATLTEELHAPFTGELIKAKLKVEFSVNDKKGAMPQFRTGAGSGSADDSSQLSM